ncbi:MAG TPA: hypothetical protein VMJ10_31495 [Kofleriaceae bacterium]|nr:hypothetical protein [Kofleriaceae bacterium]
MSHRLSHDDAALDDDRLLARINERDGVRLPIGTGAQLRRDLEHAAEQIESG